MRISVYLISLISRCWTLLLNLENRTTPDHLWTIRLWTYLFANCALFVGWASATVLGFSPHLTKPSKYYYGRSIIKQTELSKIFPAVWKVSVDVWKVSELVKVKSSFPDATPEPWRWKGKHYHCCVSDFFSTRIQRKCPGRVGLLRNFAMNTMWIFVYSNEPNINLLARDVYSRWNSKPFIKNKFCVNPNAQVFKICITAL